MGAQAQAHTAESSGVDTLNTRVVPIVFVPGVMGSRLDISGAASDWDPDDTLEMAGWVTSTRRRCVGQLDFRTGATLMRGMDDSVVSGVHPMSDILARPRLKEIPIDQLSGPPPVPRAALAAQIRFYQGRGWGEIAWSFYGQILMDLEEQLNAGSHASEQRPVYACGYDWRQSNTTSAQRLIARINQALKDHPSATQVLVVTHSMGGLVARAALVAGAEPLMLGIVHTVMPAVGAVVAYRRFLTGARVEHADGDANFAKILGGTRLHYSVMQSVLRGPTELMPHDAYPEDFLRFGEGVTNKFFSDVFAEYTRNIPPGVMFKAGEVDESEHFDLEMDATDVTNLSARLSEARTFSRSVANRFHANTFLLFGDQVATDVVFDWKAGKATADGANMVGMVTRSPAGDGTVPSASSRADACTPLARDSFPVEHAACFANAPFRAATIDRVRRVLALP